MSRRPRRRQPSQGAAAPVAAPPRDIFQSIRAFSPFDSARWSERRTFVPFYSRDTAVELTGFELEMVRNKSRYFYDNGGLPAAIIDGIANLIGYLMPQPRTADQAWNKEAKELFAQFACNPAVFDRAGKYDFRAWQIQNNVCRFKDGDMLSVLSETPAGLGRVIVYEAHQIGSAMPGPQADARLQDGVWKDNFGRHIAYRLIDPNSQDAIATVKAQDAIFFARFRSPSQVRGYPVLSGVLNHLHDRQDIWTNVKTGIKAASEVLMYEKKDPNVRYPSTTFGLVQEATTGQTEAVDGTQQDITAKINSMRLTGVVPDMAPGSSIEVLHDERPGPNQREFLEDLVRDICVGVGVDPEIIWNIIGQTGPSVRYLMAKFQRFTEVEQSRLRTICHRFYVYFIAKAIKAKFLAPIDGWWKADWIPQSDMTIDVGREGKLALDQLRVGATTHNRIWHQAGGDADDAFDEHLAYLARCRDKASAMGFDGLRDVMPGFYDGKAEPTVAPDPNDPPAPLPPKKK